MKFGIHYQLPCGDGQWPADRWDTIDQAVHAERLGYESVWPVEQHSTPHHRSCRRRWCHPGTATPTAPVSGLGIVVRGGQPTVGTLTAGEVRHG